MRKPNDATHYRELTEKFYKVSSCGVFVYVNKTWRYVGAFPPADIEPL